MVRGTFFVSCFVCAVAAATAGTLAQSVGGMPSLPSGPGMPDIAGMGLQTQKGTWAYVVGPSALIESHLEGQQFADADGIDSDFMAAASVHASRTVPGPDLCEPSRKGVSDFRVLGMQIFSRDVPFMSGEQESRLIVNQEEQRAVIYLHGDVREWGPGPNYCEDGQMRLVGSGRGMLRLEYETTSHIAPLNFLAYPRSWEIDQEGFEEACNNFRSMMFTAYKLAYPRWQTIGVESPPGPIDWSQLTPPPVPEGTSDGEKASFLDGTYNHRQSADAVAQTNSTMGLAQALAPAFESTPRVPASAGAFVGWAVQEAVGHYAGVAVDNHVANALETMKHINQQFAAEPTTSNVATYASRPASFNETTYSGIDVDYLTDTVLDICATTEIPDVEEGYAAGHFSWSSGTIQLVGRGAVKGMPAAQAIAPVTPPGGMSISDALAMARSMGAQDVPDVEEIESQLPEGYSLTKSPIHMTGRAGSGPTIAPNLQEWTISYFVELKDKGEKIGDVWFDPRR